MVEADRNIPAAMASFLVAYFEDQEAGRQLPVEHYQRLLPGYEAEIAERFRQVVGGGPPALPEQSQDPGGSDGIEFSNLAIGPYRVLRELGRGGQGAVYLAEHRELGRRVALKVLGVQGLLSDSARLRFRREIEVTSKLDHPGIGAVYEAGESDGTAWVAMRLVEGETLAGRLAAARYAMAGASGDAAFHVDTDPECPRDESTSGGGTKGGPTTRGEILDTVRLFESAAQALHAAHEAGIIHRDIKPGNIMIDREGKPVILDFGLARELDGGQPTLTLTGDLLGTPAYLSPEQLTRQAIELDRRSDVYSLGVTLYECLTLRRPFEGVSRQALYQAILAKDPPDPSRANRAISRDLKVILETALEKDRDRRYQTALDLAEDLRRFRAHEPIRARPVGPLPRLWRWAQRNPLVATLSVGFALAVSAGLVASLVFFARAEASAEEARTNLESARFLHGIATVKGLIRRAHALWPPGPEMTAPLREWLDDAEIVGAGVNPHRQVLDAAVARWLPPDQSNETSLRHAETGIPWPRNLPWKQRSELEILAEMVADERLLFEDQRLPGPTAASVRWRLDWSKRLMHASEDYNGKWVDAIRDIADPGRCPAYGGLRIKPQLGLIPIRRNPASGLWEFAHLMSGSPARIRETGDLTAGPEQGLVLVLIPAGKFNMGASDDDDLPDGFRSTALRDAEKPSHELTLDPFFISKYEMTQGQWLAFTGVNPSEHQRAPDALEHPVENVSWSEAAGAFRMLGLALPTEAQWEFAARARTRTPWWTGVEPSSLEGAANLHDQTAIEEGAPTSWGKPETWLRDGFTHHAAVTSLRPNGFGLHHVCGNVWEWCQDTYDFYANAEPRAGDCLRQRAIGGLKPLRGGAFDNGANAARSAYRDGADPGTRVHTVGVRPARMLDR